jgi:uncharacterized paraquat-inducible protein A
MNMLRYKVKASRSIISEQKTTIMYSVFLMQHHIMMEYVVVEAQIHVEMSSQLISWPLFVWRMSPEYA